MLRNLIIFVSLSMSCFGQENTYFIKLSPQTSELSLHTISVISSYHCPFSLTGMQQTYLLQLTDNLTIDELKHEIGQSFSYEFIEKVPKDELFFSPNDFQSSQYALSIINAQQAWDLNLDASSIRIGVIDNAISTSHPDLVSSIWINPNEIPNDGIDNDQNGYIDDISGWDFGNSDNNTNPPVSSMLHGTHVAGIAGASTNNGVGISSIGMNAKIFPIKIGVDATGALVNGPIAVDYAISMGVEVINMSWGSPFYSQVYQDLFDIANQEDIVCIAAAGNNSTNAPMYPASYNYVISIAATNAFDQVSNFSNFGPTTDMAAPGSNIYSTLPNGQYGNLSGTSMAAPLVSGLVALMRDANPLATNTEIEACLTNSCDVITGPQSNQIGAGRINAYQAMLCITAPTAQFDSDLTQTCPGNSISFYNYSNWPGTTYSWSFPGGVPSTSNAQNPIVFYPVPGQYNVTLSVSNGLVNQTITENNYISVIGPTATVSGVSSIISGGYGSVSINFTGVAPYNIVITDGTNNYPVNGITSSPYVHLFNPTIDTDYSILNFNDSQCPGTFSGVGTINVTTVSSSGCDTSNVAFLKYLGTDIDDMPRGLSDFGQFGYLVYGCKEFSNSNFRTYVCRLDKCGNILWENIYAPSEYGLPVAATMEGNEIILLSYNGITFNNVRTTLTRLDLNGNVLGALRIGGSNNSTYPRFMVKGQNGDLIVGSVTNSTPSIGGNDLHVVRTQPNGTIVWQKRIGSVNTEFLHNIYEDNQGDILVTGYMIDAGIRSGFITKLSANGNLLWSKKYNMGSGETYIFDLLELNGYYYSTGSADQGTFGSTDGILVKTDLNGNLIWSKRMGNAGAEVNGCLAAMNDTIYIIGRSDSGLPNSDIVLYRFDQSGGLIDYGGFGTPVEDRIGANGKFIRLSTEGDIMGLSSGNAGALGGYDIAFFRFNNYSDICQPSTINVQSSNIGLQAINNQLTIQTPTWSFISAPMTVSPVVSNQGFACINTINTPCTISADFTPSQGSCFTDSVNFTDFSVGSLINSWSFGDNSATNFLNPGNISHVYPSAGNYSVQLIVIDTLTGCLDSITQQITIVPNPSIDLPDTLSGCPGDTLAINLIENCLSNQASVTWSPGSVIVDLAGNNPSVLLDQPQYIVVTIIDNGVTLVDSVFLAISPGCCYSDVIIEQPSSVCLNEPIQFIQNSIVNGNATYTWSFLPDGMPSSTSNATPPLVTYLSPGVKYAILEITDSCGTNVDTLTFSLFDPPIFSIGNDTTLCHDTQISLGDLPVESWDYVWTPSNNISDSTSSNPIATINNDLAISVTVTDSWTGCQFHDTIQFTMDSVFVNILMSDTSLCEPEIITIPVTHSGYSDLYWTPMNSIVQVSQNSADVSISNTMTLIANAYGQSGMCYVSDSITITMINAPDPIFIDTIICEGKQFVYYTPGVWLDENQTVTVISLNTPGSYLYTEEHICGQVQHQVVLNASIDCWCDVYVPNSFTPDGSELNNSFIPVSQCTFTDYDLKIFNRWGEVIFESSDPFIGWNGTYKNTPVQDGTYTWILEYSREQSDESVQLNGHVTLLK